MGSLCLLPGTFSSTMCLVMLGLPCMVSVCTDNHLLCTIVLYCNFLLCTVGVEPWSFYFINGFLNFNVVFILALLAIPLIEFRVKEFSPQGVIQDFEVEGGNKKSNQNILLKKRSTVISIPCYSM